MSFSLVLESCWGPHVLGHQARHHWWQYSRPSWTRSRSPVAKKDGQSLGSPMIFTHTQDTFLNPYQIYQEKCGHHGSRHHETPSVIQLGKMAATCPRPSLCLMATTAGPTVSTTLVTCSCSWICHQRWRMKAEEQATLEYASERSASCWGFHIEKGKHCVNAINMMEMHHFYTIHIEAKLHRVLPKSLWIATLTYVQDRGGWLI